jgi:hypothetical protein
MSRKYSCKAWIGDFCEGFAVYMTIDLMSYHITARCHNPEDRNLQVSVYIFIFCADDLPSITYPQPIISRSLFPVGLLSVTCSLLIWPVCIKNRTNFSTLYGFINSYTRIIHHGSENVWGWLPNKLCDHVWITGFVVCVTMLYQP